MASSGLKLVEKLNQCRVLARKYLRPITKQQVPSPRLAHVEENASVSEILVDEEMKLTEPMADGSKILDSEKYLDFHKMARRLINYRSHGFYLNKRKRESDDKFLSETPHEVTGDVFSLGDKMTDFVQLIEDCSKEID